MSQGDGLTYISRGPSDFWLIGATPGSPYIEKLGSWTDVTAPFLADPAAATGDVYSRFSSYVKYGMIWEAEYIKSYDGLLFTDLTPTCGFVAPFAIADVDDSPNFWLVGGGKLAPAFNTRLIRLNHNLTTSDISAASGFTRPISSIRYSPSLGIFLISDWVSVKSYNGIGFTNVSIGCFPYGFGNIEWNGSYFMYADGAGTETFDGVAIANISATQYENIRWNGSYWLMSINVTHDLVMYDGVGFTIIKTYPNTIRCIGWNGLYWLIGGGDGLGTQFLEKYDGSTFTNVLTGSGFGNYLTSATWFAIL